LQEHGWIAEDTQSPSALQVETFYRDHTTNFGVIQGTVSSDGTSVQGQWYEARNPFSNCAHGGFTFKLQNSNHWDGNYDCADETNKNNYEWDANRFSPDIVPSYVDCAVLAKKQANLKGAWIVDPSISTYWDICTSSDEKYTSSYECDTNLDCFGFEQGFIFENGRVLLGGFTNVYPDGNTVDGSSLIAYLNDSTLIHYQWANPISTPRVLSNQQHVAEFDIVFSNKTSTGSCNRNKDIYGDLYVHFSSSSLPNDYTVVSGYHHTTQKYSADTNEKSSVQQADATSASSPLTLCFILATIILLLV